MSTIRGYTFTDANFTIPHLLSKTKRKCIFPKNTNTYFSDINDILESEVVLIFRDVFVFNTL